MKKKILTLSLALVTSFVLSGCSISNPVAPKPVDQMPIATVLKSTDAGTTWTPKINIDANKNISGIDVLTIAMHPVDPNIIYLGTPSSGLFMTKDGGETWSNVAFADKAYGLVFDSRDPNVMYGSGVFKDRAKIFKRLGDGQEWKEVYTEPANGTIISSLAIDPKNSQVLYAGTDNGVIIKTADGGKTWVNLKKADNQVTGPITSIAFDIANSSHVFFAVFQSGILETKDGGNSLEDITSKFNTSSSTTGVYSLIADPYLSGVMYAGTDKGIFKKVGNDKWESLNIIESSKAFPIRAMAINPRNSREIMYSSSKAMYKSIDGGTTWSTFQLDTNKEISVLKYNALDPSMIYAGLRSF